MIDYQLYTEVSANRLGRRGRYSSSSLLAALIDAAGRQR